MENFYKEENFEDSDDEEFIWSDQETTPEFYTNEELRTIQQKIENLRKLPRKDLLPANDDDTVSLGCKLTALIANDEAELHGELIAEAYVNYPPFLFYTDHKHRAIIRIYAMCIDNERIAVNAMGAMCGINHELVEPCDTNDFVAVKKWSVSQKMFLESGLIKDPGNFYTAMGFLGFRLESENLK